MARAWHMVKSEGQVTLSRQLPARFDVSAETGLGAVNAPRLAHQIRQDMWRALQNVRGFSPVVQITQGEGELHIRAGGRVMGPVSQKLVQTITDVLENPQNRARWMRCARLRKDAL